MASEFLGRPFQGPPSVPHASEEFFKVYFLGAHLAIAISSFPGRVLGTEARPRKFNREYVINVTNEHAKRREAASGKVPRQWFKGRPRLTDQSWEKMWNAHLHWKRWTQERMGPYNSPI
ncbi:hypothetical protein PSENEW3n2_00001887 [Picochlorum sp. SENEW3]|nr:hypothetical protein PSENEW3n2_00001887 [Picochlorum sp. SENEW3]WPT14657.1 hypothetical protein PSENEW3_00001887 [Picochlorum sp. SENEW3]